MKKLGSVAACLVVLAVAAWAANPIQIKYEDGTGSGFFGGDYRDGNTARNIGQGVAITLTEDVMVDQFAFSLGAFENDETSEATDVTLVYTMRKADGTIMKMEEVEVADTFSGGWVHWMGINQAVAAPGPVIFTCHVKDGESNYGTGSANGDTDAGDSSSVRYVVSKSDDPYDMITWDGFYEHSWDCHYWFQGKPHNNPIPPYPIVMAYDAGSSSGWFGGDYRDGSTSRNIGTGISVTIDTHMVVQSVSLEFGTFRNDSSSAWPVEATLVFALRDVDGSIIKTEEVVVDTSFDGGYVTWSGINQAVNAPGPVIVTCYIKDAHVNYTKSSSYGDSDAGAENVERLSCTQSEDPYDLDDWENWGTHSWDPHYILEARASVEGVGDLLSGTGMTVPGLTVSPNPFVQTVAISLKDAGQVDYVTIQDLQGREIRRLDGGSEAIVWDGTDANGMRVQPGAYVGIVVKDGASIRTGIILSN